MRLRPTRLAALSLLAPLTLVAAACAPVEDDTASDSASAGTGDCDPATLPLVTDGTLTVGTDSPAFEPWFVDDDPTNGEGFESAVAYAVAGELGFDAADVTWVTVPFNTSYRPGAKDFDFDINQISITPERAEEVDFSDGYYSASQAVVALDGSAGADATSLDDLKGLRLGAQTGTTSLTAIRDVIEPDTEPLVFEDTNAAKQALENDQVDAILADLPTAFYISSVEIPGSSLIGQFQVEGGDAEEFGLLLEKGSGLTSCVDRALTTLREDGTLDDLEQQWLSDVVDVPDPVTGSTVPAGTWTPSPREQERRDVRRRLRRRSLLVASATTVAFFVLLGAILVTSPGWPTVKATFFSAEDAGESFPAILEGFWLNVRMFLIAEPLILVVALALALARQSRAAWLTPVRALAVAYVDFFRGVPTILLVLMFAFGMPSLGLQGIPNSLFFWALVALVVSYSAYVAEVFRAGIESIHPSQLASADALGLSRAQAMRHVVVPQAVRRVVPPLLNDFVSLTKDTALVSSVALFDALFSARDYAAYNFNFTPYVVVSLFFVVLTVPLARMTDHLQRRSMRREQAGAR